MSETLEGWNRKWRTMWYWSQVYFSFKAAQARSRMLPPEAVDEFWRQKHSYFAAKVWKNISSLRGWWVKVGQFLSTRSDMLPEEYIEYLTRLQDMMPTTDFESVKKIIESEYGCELQEVFSDFQEEAIASASIGQVHKATLLDGSTVVVKVQHADVHRTLRQDMATLTQLNWAFEMLEGGVNFAPILEEWQKAAGFELDFRMELIHQMRACEGARRGGLDIIIPRCYPHLTTQKVMVMDFCRGFKITDSAKLNEYGVDREKLMRKICEAFAYQIHIDGMFNGDPHPGNILVQIDAETNEAHPVLLDWGLVKVFDTSKRVAFSRMVFAVATLDVMGLMAAFEDMGFVFKSKTVIDPEFYMDALRVGFFRDSGEGPIVNKEQASSAVQAAKDAGVDKQAIAENNPLEDWPKDIIFFIRVASLLHGLCLQLDAKVPFLEILVDKARQCLYERYTPSSPLVYVRYPPQVNIHAARGLMSPRSWSKAISLRGQKSLKGIGDGGASPLGSRHSKFEWRLHKLLWRLRRQGLVLGCQVAVVLKKKVIVNTCIGQFGPTDRRPVRPDSLFAGGTVCQGLLATAVLMLVEQKQLDLEDRVCNWWDGFVRFGKRGITVRHILAHRAGLHRALPSDLSLSKFTDYDEMVRLLEDSLPCSTPGALGRFAFLTSGWVLSELVRCVTSVPIQQFVQKEIAARIGVQNAFFYPIPEALILHAASAAAAGGSLSGLGRNARVSEGGGGVMDSAEDMNVMAANLPAGGGALTEAPGADDEPGNGQDLGSITARLLSPQRPRGTSASAAVASSESPAADGRLDIRGAHGVIPPRGRASSSSSPPVAEDPAASGSRFGWRRSWGGSGANAAGDRSGGGTASGGNKKNVYSMTLDDSELVRRQSDSRRPRQIRTEVMAGTARTEGASLASTAENEIERGGRVGRRASAGGVLEGTEEDDNERDEFLQKSGSRRRGRRSLLPVEAELQLTEETVSALGGSNRESSDSDVKDKPGPRLDRQGQSLQLSGRSTANVVPTLMLTDNAKETEPRAPKGVPSSNRRWIALFGRGAAGGAARLATPEGGGNRSVTGSPMAAGTGEASGEASAGDEGSGARGSAGRSPTPWLQGESSSPASSAARGRGGETDFLNRGTIPEMFIGGQSAAGMSVSSGISILDRLTCGYREIKITGISNAEVMEKIEKAKALVDLGESGDSKRSLPRFTSKYPSRILRAAQKTRSAKPDQISGLELAKAKPHVLDPLIYDSRRLYHLVIPPTNGRFSALALSHFYSAVAGGTFFSKELLCQVMVEQTVDDSLDTLLAISGGSRHWGLGYQLYPCIWRGCCSPPSAALAPHSPSRRSASCTTTTTSTTISSSISNFHHHHRQPPAGAPPTAEFASTAQAAGSGGGRLPAAPSGGAQLQSALKSSKAANGEQSARPRVNSVTIDEHPKQRTPVSPGSGSVDSVRNSTTNHLTNKPLERGATVTGIGHSDLGGSIALCFPEVDLSIAILVNDMMNGPRAVDDILRFILAHFSLQPAWDVAVDVGEVMDGISSGGGRDSVTSSS